MNLSPETLDFYVQIAALLWAGFTIVCAVANNFFHSTADKKNESEPGTGKGFKRAAYAVSALIIVSGLLVAALLGAVTGLPKWPNAAPTAEATHQVAPSPLPTLTPSATFRPPTETLGPTASVTPSATLAGPRVCLINRNPAAVDAQIKLWAKENDQNLKNRGELSSWLKLASSDRSSNLTELIHLDTDCTTIRIEGDKWFFATNPLVGVPLVGERAVQQDGFKLKETANVPPGTWRVIRILLRMKGSVVEGTPTPTATATP